MKNALLRMAMANGWRLDYAGELPSLVSPAQESFNPRNKGGRPCVVDESHCPKGHALEGDNLYLTKEGRRHCKACRRIAMGYSAEYRRPSNKRKFIQETHA